MDGAIGSMVSDQMVSQAAGAAANEAAAGASSEANESAAGAAADASAAHAGSEAGPGTGATSQQFSTMPAVNSPGPASTQATQLPAPQTYQQSMNGSQVAQPAQAPSGQASSNPVKGDTGGFETGFNTMFKDEYQASKDDAQSMAKMFSMSDERQKTGVKDGRGRVEKALGALDAKEFDYRDPAKDGAGRQVGVMAQDLQRAGLGHVVQATPRGLMVDGGKLSAFNVASNVVLAEKVKGLERLTAKLQDRFAKKGGR